VTPRPWSRRLLRWTLRGAALLGGVLVTALAASAAFHALRQAGEARQFPPPGRLVDVGGHRLHLDCAGERHPTVVLEAPAGGSSLGWSLVQPGIARETRTCSYDRAGLGWSEAGPTPRSASRIVGELHALLTRSGEAGPYVLVGSSIGGVYLRLFTARHPGAVAGIVFVDAAHEHQFDDNPGWRDEVEGARRMLTLARVAAPLGLLRVLDMPFGDGSASWLPSPLLPAARAVGFRSAWVATVADELDALDTGLGEVAAAVDAMPTPAFPDLPVVVLTRGQPEGEGAEQYSRWLDVQRRLMAFSSRSVQVTVPGSGHFIQADHPEAVVDAVYRVLREVRSAPPHSRSGPAVAGAGAGGRIPGLSLPGRESMVDVGGRNLDCRVYGSGPPTVVLLSSLSTSQEYWSPVVPGLAAKATVVTYDRAGVGRSEIGARSTHGEASARDLHVLLARLGVPRPYLLVGHSYGGNVARLFASMYPGDLGGLVLEETQHEDVLDGMRKILTGQDLAMFEEVLAPRFDEPDHPRTEEDCRAVTREQVRSSGPPPQMPFVVLTCRDRASAMRSLFSDEAIGRSRSSTRT
jgi:pimeloyl-ACP methyl ester carboxylesterase